MKRTTYFFILLSFFTLIHPMEQPAHQVNSDKPTSSNQKSISSKRKNQRKKRAKAVKKAAQTAIESPSNQTNTPSGNTPDSSTTQTSSPSDTSTQNSTPQQPGNPPSTNSAHSTNFLQETLAAVEFSEDLTPYSQAFCDTVISGAPDEVKDEIEWLADPKTRNNVLPEIMLFYGQQGAGKTTLARAIVQKMGSPFIIIQASLLGNEFINSESSGLKRMINYAIHQGRNIVIDEIDILAKCKKDHKKEEVDNQTATALWQLLDNLQEKKLLLIGTTNDKSDMPPQLQDRFDSVYEIPLQSGMDKIEETLNHYLIGKHVESGLLIKIISAQAQGLSNRQLRQLVKRAYKVGLKRSAHFLRQSDFEQGIKFLKNKERLLKTTSWNKKEFFTYTIQTIGAIASIASVINAGFAIYNGHQSLNLGYLNYATQQANNNKNVAFQEKAQLNQQEALKLQATSLTLQKWGIGLGLTGGIVGTGACCLMASGACTIS